MLSEMKVSVVLVLLMVLIPGLYAQKNIAETASQAGQFKVLLKAAEAAGLVEALTGSTNLTVLAPTDAAFAKLPAGVVESLLKPENKEQLANIIKYHVLAGKLSAKQLVASDKLTTLLGKELILKIDGGQLMVNEAKIVATDIAASNGVIHVIEQVLLPPQPLTFSQKAKQMIELAIDDGVDTFNDGDHKNCATIYEYCLRSILIFGEADLPAATLSEIKNALVKGEQQDMTSKSWALRKVIDKVYTDLDKKTVSKTSTITPEFKVLSEAKLPVGFPKPGPLGKVIIKDYPAYRAAKVVDGSSNSAFMKLFGHIKENNISMTAPVEMSLSENGNRSDMAFLYESPQQGKAGLKNNGVEVVDLPARQYISIGFNGRDTETVIKAAVAQLENWLSQQDSVVADGSYRLLGYNSPMVPADKRFWEVQIPIKSGK